MSNNTGTDNRNREIDILKSTINNLIQENKQLLQSNKQLKKEDSKLRNFIINIVARELETQIQLILGSSKFLLEHYKSPQQFPNIRRKEEIIGMTELAHRAALKLHLQVEGIKLDVSRSTYR